MKMEKGHKRTVLIGTSPSCSLSCWPVLMTPPLRCPIQQLLPSVSPAPAETAGETPLHGAAPAQQPGLLRGAPGALLRGLPPLWECRVDSPIQRVRKSFSSEEEIKGLRRGVSGAFHVPPPPGVPTPWTQAHSSRCCWSLRPHLGATSDASQ